MPRIVSTNPTPVSDDADDAGTLGAADASRAARLLDELAWWQNNGQLRYKSDEEARPPKGTRGRQPDRKVRPIDIDTDDAGADRIRLAR